MGFEEIFQQYYDIKTDTLLDIASGVVNLDQSIVRQNDDAEIYLNYSRLLKIIKSRKKK